MRGLTGSSNSHSCAVRFAAVLVITEFCISGFTAHACAVRSRHVWYLWRMPEMDAPRAFVFRPLVKGNEALGTRLAAKTRDHAQSLQCCACRCAYFPGLYLCCFSFSGLQGVAFIDYLCSGKQLK